MLRNAIGNVAHAVVRRLVPPPEPFGQSRLQPVSRLFGLDRGKPIDRHYIEAFLEANSSFIKGAALEVAEPMYAAAYRDSLSSIEILHVAADNENATLVGDLTKFETLPAQLADCFICTQTLPYIFDLSAATRGIHHLLKPGGTLLATVSGIAQISRYDMERWGDFWRFTPLSARRLMESVFDPESVVVESYGNLFAAKAFLDGLCVEDLPDPAVLNERDPIYPITIGIRATRKLG